MLKRRPDYGHLNPAKRRVIDVCFDRLGCTSFADLGGIWAVDGGYSRYAADVHGAARGVLVDEDLSPGYRAAAAKLPNLTEVVGNFGAEAVAAQVGAVDVVLLFDVLLHQVAPDWTEVLARWAPHTDRFAIVQPQYDGHETVRLLDLGEEAYIERVPNADLTPGSIYEGLFARLDEVNERRGRPWRDVHDIWQWGITDAGLVAALAELGYGVRSFEHTGPWQGHPYFHESAFVFDRSVPPS